MNHADPPGWAGARAQLHDAARTARQVADGTEPAPAQPCSPPVPRPRTEAPLMPADPTPSQQPGHPVHTLTARQLRDYRRDLEHALKDLPAHAPARDLLARHLAEILAEQDSRTPAVSPPAPGTGR